MQCGDTYSKVAEFSIDELKQKRQFDPIFQMSTVALETSYLPIGSHYLRCKLSMPRGAQSIVHNFYAIGSYSEHSRTMMDLFYTVAQAIFSDLHDMYSRQVHGYFQRHDDYGTYDGIIGYAIIMVFSESNLLKADHVDRFIEQYRSVLVGLVERMGDEEFAEIKAATYGTDMCTWRRANMNWIEIILQQYDFSRFDRQVKYLADITKSDFIDFVRVHCSQEVRKLSTQIVRDPLAPHDGKLNMLSTQISFLDSTAERFSSDYQTFKDCIFNRDD